MFAPGTARYCSPSLGWKPSKSQDCRDTVAARARLHQAVEFFHKDFDKLDHRTRVLASATAMEQFTGDYRQTAKPASSMR
jgi:hypothetical protein